MVAGVSELTESTDDVVAWALSIIGFIVTVSGFFVLRDQERKALAGDSQGIYLRCDMQSKEGFLFVPWTRVREYQKEGNVFLIEAIRVMFDVSSISESEINALKRCRSVRLYEGDGLGKVHQFAGLRTAKKSLATMQRLDVRF